MKETGKTYQNENIRLFRLHLGHEVGKGLVTQIIRESKRARGDDDRHRPAVHLGWIIVEFVEFLRATGLHWRRRPLNHLSCRKEVAGDIGALKGHNLARKEAKRGRLREVNLGPDPTSFLH